MEEPVGTSARGKGGGSRPPRLPVRKVTLTLRITLAAIRMLGQVLPEAVHPRARSEDTAQDFAGVGVGVGVGVVLYA